MILRPSIAFDEFAGSANGVTVAKSRGRKYIRNKGYGNTSNTATSEKSGEMPGMAKLA